MQIPYVSKRLGVHYISYVIYVRNRFLRKLLTRHRKLENLPTQVSAPTSQKQCFSSKFRFSRNVEKHPNINPKNNRVDLSPNFTLDGLIYPGILFQSDRPKIEKIVFLITFCRFLTDLDNEIGQDAWLNGSIQRKIGRKIDSSVFRIDIWMFFLHLSHQKGNLLEKSNFLRFRGKW